MMTVEFEDTAAGELAGIVQGALMTYAKTHNDAGEIPALNDLLSALAAVAGVYLGRIPDEAARENLYMAFGGHVHAAMQATLEAVREAGDIGVNIIPATRSNQ